MNDEFMPWKPKTRTIRRRVLFWVTLNWLPQVERKPKLPSVPIPKYDYLPKSGNLQARD